MDSGLGFGDFTGRFFSIDSVGCSLDISKMGLNTQDFADYESSFEAAHQRMVALEAGAQANTSEGRRVGHYWLRCPELAPDDAVLRELDDTQQLPRACARDIRDGAIHTSSGGRFRHVLWIGMGGSSLGPQLLASALRASEHGDLSVTFLDNADPDGLADVISSLVLAETLVVVVSKSGTTNETLINLDAVEDAFRRSGVRFSEHAIGITRHGSPLWTRALSDGWQSVLSVPLWVGGRTSLWGASGLFFSELFGFDADALLSGARAMDEATRGGSFRENPAALLAAAWHHATGGAARRAMVLLPYSDRLQLFGRYAQQLVMESIGKRHDRAGNVVQQGLTVYGNKGSTDQHALVQQLREGPDDCFAVFVEVLAPLGRGMRIPGPHSIAERHRAGLLGTRKALAEAGKASATISIPRVDARSLGALIALFERAVGFYAEWVDVNAYDQPGVEAGKRAAAACLELKEVLRSALGAEPKSAIELAKQAQQAADADVAFYLLRGLAACESGVVMDSGLCPATARFRRGP